MMVYSIANVTSNAADRLRESDSLVRFAYNHARQNWYEGVGGAVDDVSFGFGCKHIVQAMMTPALFLYLLTTGPFLYKIDATKTFKQGQGLEGNL